MILKSSQRAGAGALGRHLISETENETVSFSEHRGVLGETVPSALREMMQVARASRATKPLFHISMNPDRDMSTEQWQWVWEEFEAEYGLTEHAFIEVTHTKADGRLHKHRVYNRVLDGKAITLSFTRLRNEKLARRCEHAFGHALTPGKHNRAVMKKLRSEGHMAVVQWLEEAGVSTLDRPQARVNHAEHQQQRRTKLDIEVVKAELREAYARSDTGLAFQSAIAEKGYVLAKGDRRDTVILDRAGGLHSPPRRLGVKTKVLRERWADLDLSTLPIVEDVQQQLNPERAFHKTFQAADPHQALMLLEQERDLVTQDIETLQCEIAQKHIMAEAGGQTK